MLQEAKKALPKPLPLVETKRPVFGGRGDAGGRGGRGGRGAFTKLRHAFSKQRYNEMPQYRKQTVTITLTSPTQDKNTLFVHPCYVHAVLSGCDFVTTLEDHTRNVVPYAVSVKHRLALLTPEAGY